MPCALCRQSLPALILELMKILVLFLAICSLTAWGCESLPPVPAVIIRPDEPLPPAEWATFERIVKSLPGEKLPSFAPLFAPPAAWKEQRTIAIADLLTEESAALAKAWNPTELGVQWNRSIALQRALRIEQVTPEQFAAWTQALSLAAMRGSANSRYLSDNVRKESLLSLRHLEHDERMFSTLTHEERYRVLREARALSRVNRIEWLMKAPAENIKLVQQHEAWLKKVLPAHVWSDPLQEVVDRETALGIPFSELRTEADATLRFNPHEGALFQSRPPESGTR